MGLPLVWGVAIHSVTLFHLRPGGGRLRGVAVARQCAAKPWDAGKRQARLTNFI
ncbi:hypothetical protein PCL1606_36690 [Pseudomonas chlororaphis]|uniref:Uncharacterized protein n=1 Tax=Pseudomonas chlororaphis TaxID=587753 RepID=A0A0D5Y1F4_9PSED|nr:hypothetical protein PCL1606_36690 [Pseudomonas chlororaphis]